MENIGELAHRINIVVPVDEVAQEMNKRLQKISNTTEMAGFRKGKVPISLLEKRFGPSIKAEVTDEFANRGLDDAMKKNDLQLTVQPELKSVKTDKGAPIEISLEVEVFPDLKLKELKEIEINTIHIDVTDKDTDDVLNNMAKLNPEFKKVDRVVKQDDQLDLKISSHIVSESTTTDQQKDLEENTQPYTYSHRFGQEHNIKEFDAALKDVKTGEIREFDMQYAKDHPNKKFAGQTIHHRIEVVEVKEPIYAKLDDEFAKKMGIQDGIAALKESVKKQLDDQSNDLQLQENNKRVFAKLLEINELTLPPKLLQHEIDIFKRMNYPDKSVEAIEKLPVTTEVEEKAKQNVQRALVSRALMKQLNIVLDQQRFQAKLMKIVQQYENPTEVLQQLVKDKHQLAQIQALIAEEQLVEELLKIVKTNLETVNYSDYINHEKQSMKANETISN